MWIATLALLATPQTVVTETVTHSQAPASYLTSYPDFGLPGAIDESHGTPVEVHVSGTLQFDTSGTWTNTGTAAAAPYFWITDILGPNPGDCTAYKQCGEFIHFAPVAPGQTLDLTASISVPFQFTAPANFSPVCNVPWNWTDVRFFPDPSDRSSLYDPFSHNTISDGDIEATLTATFTFVYEPTPLPQASVCPGTHPGGAPLVVGGSPRLPWFDQANAPATLGIVVVSTTASTTVPADGLCITQGGGRVARLTDPANLAAAPVRGELPAVLSGSTVYFQSWMASAAGGSPTTGECVAVTLP